MKREEELKQNEEENNRNKKQSLKNTKRRSKGGRELRGDEEKGETSVCRGG